MPWKYIGEGDTQTIEVKDGKPVFVYPDGGKEVPFDADQAVSKITSLSAESKTHREAKERAELELAPYKALGELPAVTELTERAKKIDAKKLIDSGDVDKFKKEWEVGWSDKLKAAEEKNAALEKSLFEEKVGSRFATSPYVKDKLMIGPVTARAIFGDNFKLEDGNAVGYHNGSKITSRERFGEPASFDEALEIILSTHPERERLMRDAAGSGAGTKPSVGTQTPPAEAKKPATTLEIDFSKRDLAKGEKPEDIMTRLFKEKMKGDFPDNPELLNH